MIQWTLFYGSSALRCVEADTPSRARPPLCGEPRSKPPPALIFFPTKLDAGLPPAVFELLRAAVNRGRSGLRAPPSPSAPHPFRRFRRPALALHPPPAVRRGPWAAALWAETTAESGRPFAGSAPPCRIWSGRSSLGWRRRGAGLPHRCAVAGSQSRSGAPSAFLTGSAPSASWLLPSPSGARLPPPHFSGGLAGLLAGHAATAGGGSRRPPVACWCGVGARLPLVPRRRGQRTRSPSGQRSRRSSAARRAGGQSRRPARGTGAHAACSRLSTQRRSRPGPATALSPRRPAAWG